MQWTQIVQRIFECRRSKKVQPYLYWGIQYRVKVEGGGQWILVTPDSSNVSWGLSIFQRSDMKATGEKISPCRTTRKMLKVLEVSLPMRTHPKNALNIDWIILRALIETFALLRKFWLSVSKKPCSQWMVWVLPGSPARSCLLSVSRCKHEDFNQD